MLGSGKAIRSYFNLEYYAGFSPVASDYENCIDNTTPPPHKTPTSWSKFRARTVGGTLTGTTTTSLPGGGTITFNDVRALDRTTWTKSDPLTPVNWTYWVTQAIGNLNPRRPDVDLPLFLWELREFPRMLRDLGRVLSGRLRPSDVPGGYLAYQFGWKPLYSDLNSLLRLRRSIVNRIRHLRALESGKAIFRRRLASRRLIKDVTDATPYRLFAVGSNPNPWAIDGKVNHREYLTVWMTARASLKEPLDDKLDLPNRALSLSYGLTARPDLLWNSLPWSWLIDYFGNVGAFLEAQDALTYLNVSQMCLMALTVTENRLIDVKVRSGLSYTESTLYREYKQRSVHANPTPFFATQPFITDRQEAIIGSLITSRALRSARL
jgi:hypothetical protein